MVGIQEDLADSRLLHFESKKIWQIAGPSIFSRLAMFSVTVVVQAFAGHLSDLDLAAISVATTVIISISFGFLLGMASVLETLCGQSYGAKQYHMLGIYMQRSCIVLSRCRGSCRANSDGGDSVGFWAGSSTPCLCKLGFVYKLRVGIVGTALTIAFAWWLSVLGMFGYTVCGGCPQTWTGFPLKLLLGYGSSSSSLASGLCFRMLENIYYKMLVIVSGFLQNIESSIDALSICITIYGWESMIPLGFLAAVG
ncbi:hypothetical protein FNV43_RR12160 [Rhamnella rubrinervis]|uniref:Uncharacterized protein n=1 Tax=Rhamnella rubrinervis TaxID=2594499 RepID=A0A8K0H780_9ROSA|nr:hypothetical protein FNV43_RR12160 [Rhamnella rubrinervis]